MICDFSKVAFYVFGMPIHWYSLAYIFGILIALKLTNVFAEKTSRIIVNKEQIDAFVNYAIIGIVVGGRLGHVLFYDLENYLDYPIEIFKVWKGGMSFYGGFIGVAVVSFIFCRKHKIDFWRFVDLWSISVPIGLFLGRIANFINDELLGKESNVPWGVIFHYDGIIRHPSQIYEAILEGIVLFVVMILFFYRKYHKFAGRLSGIFCTGYGIARFICEFFREPDSVFSYKLFYSTNINLNQYMSIFMIALGCILIKRSIHERNFRNENV